MALEIIIRTIVEVIKIQVGVTWDLRGDTRGHQDDTRVIRMSLGFLKKSSEGIIGSENDINDYPDDTWGLSG